jgi:hypothetical protein
MHDGICQSHPLTQFPFQELAWSMLPRGAGRRKLVIRSCSHKSATAARHLKYPYLFTGLTDL